ncbi:MAG: glycosyl transferase family protein [Alphaproteobacteria bacterium]|nr:glycosyl transferase family protein [Alphaproteobacteria bacterium]
MDVAGALFGALEIIMREAGLFAAAGFFLLGVSDLAVDLLWIRLRLRERGEPPLTVADLPPPLAPAPMAVLVPAWDEAAVIGAMLRDALAAWADEDVRIFVGCYPNDPATVGAVRAVADPRVRLVVGDRDGPTTKADCLNRLWRALAEDERGGRRVRGVVLHDAEDVVHPLALRIFATLTERWDFVQLPVRPLPDPDSKWIAGHYLDEFAEAHGKELLVRQAIGAALPGAGVGCAFDRLALDLVAYERDRPFDPESLTEDYEMGLMLAEHGCSARFVRIAEATGGPFVATREYFPATLAAAVRQKSRWMAGIALLGWDRLGWRGGVAERWMRLRDRQGPLAALLLFAGYLAFGLWLLLRGRQAVVGMPPAPLSVALRWLVTCNLALLAWRLAMRFGFTSSAYGWREGLRAVPRAVVGNFVTMLAAARALAVYRRQRRSGHPRWDKTRHRFPAEGRGR